MSFDPKAELSSAQLAAVIGVTERRVQQLEAEGIFRNVGKGRSKRFILADAVQAFAKKSEMDARDEAALPGTSRAQIEIEQARKLKLANDTADALLVQTADALAAVDHITGEIRTGLAGIPARFTDDLTERRRLDDLIDVVLTEISGRFEQAGAALREGRDPLEADAAADA